MFVKIKKAPLLTAMLATAVVVVLVAALIVIGVEHSLSRPYTPRLYDHNKNLANETRTWARNKSQTAYAVRRYSTDPKLALFPVKENFSEILPLHPCNEEQANLEIGDTVEFTYSEESLDPNNKYSIELLCYMSIKQVTQP